MRICKRLLILFCVLAILLSSLSSCAGLLFLSTVLGLRESGRAGLPIGEKLAYTLTEADRRTFSDRLNALEELILTKRSASKSQITAANEKVEDSYYHIATQAELAYIYHCMNMADSEKSEAYLYATAMHSDIYSAYQAVCKRIDASDAPGREIFFAEWSEEELESMRGYSEEYSALKQQNERLLVTYRALSETESYERAPELYLQIVQNNARIASLYGYDDYCAYAYEKVYERDYSPADAAEIHRSVKTVLLPLCQRTLANFQTGYSGLSSGDRAIVRSLLEGEYETSWELLSGYFSSFSKQTENRMKGLFEEGNCFITSGKNADRGAFTSYLYEYDQPVCYFGPGYHDGYTVIHEMGHYLSAFYTAGLLPMDIAETQSQANEWLFTAYLEESLANGALAETIFFYQLHSALQTIIMASIIDEFEQSVYHDLPTSAEEFDARMEEICADYGGIASVRAMFSDPLRYWRFVTLENPCYYISYAFSMLVAVNFYEAAMRSYSAAQDAFLNLVALDPEEGDSYCAWLKEQNLHTPFEEDYYQTIAALAS